MATDEEIFASALNDEPTTAPAEAPAPVEQPQEPSGPARDEHGRFAPATPPAATEPPVAAPVAPQEHGGVPPGRLREVSERARAAEHRAEELARRLEALEARNRPAPEAAPKPEIWEAPEDFVTEHAKQIVSPLQQEIARIREHYSQRAAIQEHGEEAVKAAYDAIDEAARRGDPDAKAIAARVLDPRNLDPYGELVKGHKRIQALARVGTDPDAFVEQQLEERLKDPAFQAKLIERIRGQAASAPGAARSHSPAVSLPPSLTRASSAAPATDDDGDMSDAGLFAHATR